MYWFKLIKVGELSSASEPAGVFLIIEVAPNSKLVRLIKSSESELGLTLLVYLPKNESIVVANKQL